MKLKKKIQEFLITTLFGILWFSMVWLMALYAAPFCWKQGSSTGFEFAVLFIGLSIAGGIYGFKILLLNYKLIFSKTM
jgi:hypothetical protein